MLMDLKPYVDDIQNGYLKVEYDQERIAKISWLDQDSTEFSRVFHYNGDDLSLITEFREKSILKEFHFNSHSVTGRFIEFLFGKNFFTDDKFITEVRYNHLNFPIFYTHCIYSIYSMHTVYTLCSLYIQYAYCIYSMFTVYPPPCRQAAGRVFI